MSNTQKDQWDKALDEQILIIKRCQDEKNISSCTACNQLLNCKIRADYIKSVYESMNKGKGGGFEF